MCNSVAHALHETEEIVVLKNAKNEECSLSYKFSLIITCQNGMDKYSYTYLTKLYQYFRIFNSAGLCKFMLTFNIFTTRDRSILLKWDLKSGQFDLT